MKQSLRTLLKTIFCLYVRPKINFIFLINDFFYYEIYITESDYLYFFLLSES